MIKTPREIVPKILQTVTQATSTKNASVNTTEWAKYFEFQITGNAEEKKQLSAIVDACARFVKSVKAGDQPYWLSLLGTSGAGKTYLARKVWRWFSHSSFFRSSIDDDTKEIIYPGSWCNWPRLAGELLGNSGYGRLEDLQTEKLTILDEIGADRDPSGHVRDCMSRLLSGRVGKWTLITSNKSLGDVDRDIDTRVASRMLRDGSIVVEVDVSDFSKRK